MVDPAFAIRVFSKIPLTDETYGDYREIARAVNSHYRKYSEPVSRQALTTTVIDSINKTGKASQEDLDAVKEMVTQISRLSDEGNYSNDKQIKDQIDEWGRNQLATAVLVRELSSNKDIGSPDVLERITTGLSEALFSDHGKGEQVSLFDQGDQDKVLNLFDEVRADMVPLHWEKLDKITGGGIARGEVGLVIGGSGNGKSTTLVNIARQYTVTDSLDVLYVALEEKVAQMVLKLFRTITKQSTNSLYDSLGNANRDLIKKQLDALSSLHDAGKIGNLDLYRNDPQIVNPAMLEQMLQQYMLKHGKYPDVVIVDYPDLMDNPYLRQNINEFRAMGMLYEALRRIAGEYGVIMWVASQSNRMAGQQEVNNAFAIEGSKQKLNTVEFCMTINQTAEEFKAGFIRFYIDKVRNPGTNDFDRIIGMKVNTKAVVFEDETPEEEESHKQILANSKEDRFGEYKKTDKESKAKSKIDAANRAIAQGAFKN